MGDQLVQVVTTLVGEHVDSRYKKDEERVVQAGTNMHIQNWKDMKADHVEWSIQSMPAAEITL